MVCRFSKNSQTPSSIRSSWLRWREHLGSGVFETNTMETRMILRLILFGVGQTLIKRDLKFLYEDWKRDHNPLPC